MDLGGEGKIGIEPPNMRSVGLVKQNDDGPNFLLGIQQFLYCFKMTGGSSTIRVFFTNYLTILERDSLDIHVYIHFVIYC